jgi:hypothetical protein
VMLDVATATGLLNISVADPLNKLSAANFSANDFIFA